jgi:quercetin dioxygenase-like cupin family protein
MSRQFLCVVVGMVLGVAGLALAQQAAKDNSTSDVRIKTLLEQELKEKLDGRQGKLVLLELVRAPGTGGRPHRHPGPVVGYVQEGELEVQVDDGPVKTYKPGEVWFEPARAVHRVSRNPSKTKPARYLAFMLMTRDDKQLVLPEKD